MINNPNQLIKEIKREPRHMDIIRMINRKGRIRTKENISIIQLLIINMIIQEEEEIKKRIREINMVN